MKRNIVVTGFLFLMALGSMITAYAQGEFTLKPYGTPLIKDTARMSVPLNLESAGLLYVFNNSKSTITVNYTLINIDTISSWQYSDCDNLACYSYLKGNGQMAPINTSASDSLSNSFTVEVTPHNSGISAMTYRFYDANNTLDADTITFVFSASLAGIESALKPVNVSVFPNPAGNTIHIGVSNTEAYKNLEIISMTGARVYTQNAVNADGEVNVSSFTPGLYIIQFSDNNGNLFQGRFEKMN